MKSLVCQQKGEAFSSSSGEASGNAHQSAVEGAHTKRPLRLQF